MKTTTAFRALRNRDLNRINATKRFLVKSVNKDGITSRARVDYQFDAFTTREAADARVVALMQMNPGKTYVVEEAK